MNTATSFMHASATVKFMSFEWLHTLGCGNDRMESHGTPVYVTEVRMINGRAARIKFESNRD